MTPKNFVEEYLKSENRHDIIKDILEKEDVKKIKSSDTGKTNKKYNNYKQSRNSRQKRTLMPEAGKDVIEFVQSKDGE